MNPAFHLLLGSLMASGGGAPVAQAGGPRAAEATKTLATPWPAQEGCTSYDGADLSVDDRVSEVEWRGAGGASLAFDLAKPLSAERDQEYRLGSEGYDCHRHGTSCLVYRKPIGRALAVHATYDSRPLPKDFQAGAFGELVVRGDTRRRERTSPANAPREFGLRLIVHCQDRSKPSVAWVCDTKTCVPRIFRDNVKMSAFWREEGKKRLHERRRWPADELPNLQQWWKGVAPKDLTSLICMRGQAGIAEVERAARRRGLICREKEPLNDERIPFATARPRLIDLGRDLLRDMDLVLDELRATARALAAASDLHLVSVRAAFHDSHDEFGYGAYPSLGFTASLVARRGALEIVCARHVTLDTMGLPDDQECRLTIAARGHRLADYLPYYLPFVELPDGGAVRLLDQPPSINPNAEINDKIVIIGSALAQRPPR